MNLPEAFLSRMRTQLGETEFQAYLSAMARPARRALRVNTLKTDAAALFSLLRLPQEPCGVIPEGFFVPEGFAPGTQPLHAAGLFYMQEPSAQFPAALLGAQPGETVLDLCAAPGGKTGQLAAAMQNRGLLIANEVSPARSSVLCGTLERLGVQNALVTSMRPDALCPLLASRCDAVLVDAPCSGEAMFRRDPRALADWSEAHVLSCAERQRGILASAAEAVRPGGRLVYSTCAFSPEENEETVARFLQAHPEFSCQAQRRLYPHSSPGEGQFAALLLREGGPAPAAAVPLREPQRRAGAAQTEPPAALRRFFSETMRAPPAAQVRTLPDGRVFLLPERLPALLERMRVLRAGVLAGELRGARFVPAHGLFLAYPKSAFSAAAELEGAALSAFLAGEAIPCDPALSGYVAACVSGHPLGFGKAAGGTLKNHLPKGLRIR